MNIFVNGHPYRHFSACYFVFESEHLGSGIARAENQSGPKFYFEILGVARGGAPQRIRFLIVQKSSVTARDIFIGQKGLFLTQKFSFFSKTLGNFHPLSITNPGNPGPWLRQCI